MKATTLLTRQHHDILAILRKLKRSKRSTPARLKELANAVAAHSAIAQDIFYPAVDSVSEDIVLESLEEHALAKVALARLLISDPEDKWFSARVRGTRRLFHRHARREAEKVFPKVARALGKKRLVELGQEMTARLAEMHAKGSTAFLDHGANHSPVGATLDEA